LTGKLPFGGGSKDKADKPATPKASSASGAGGGLGGALGGLTSKLPFGGKKEDKPAAPKSPGASGGSAPASGGFGSQPAAASAVVLAVGLLRPLRPVLPVGRLVLPGDPCSVAQVVAARVRNPQPNQPPKLRATSSPVSCHSWVAVPKRKWRCQSGKETGSTP